MIALLRALLVQTIYAPADAARVIIGINLPRKAAWMALVLAAILNTLVFFLREMLIPLPPGLLLPAFQTPAIYLAALFSFTTMVVFAIYWIGRVLDGKAELPDLVSLIAWLFCVQSAADLVALVLFVFVPMLAGLFSMAAALYGIWILINFITVAQGYPDKVKAVLTIVLALVGLITGFSLFVSVLGVTAMGIS